MSSAHASTPAPLTVAGAAVTKQRSLRTKGFLATLGLLLYVLGSAVYVALERGTLYDNTMALESLSRHEKALAVTEAAVGAARVDVQEASTSGRPADALLAEMKLYMENCTKLFADLEPFDPGYALLSRAIQRSYNTLALQPVRSNWIDLREALDRASTELDIRRRTLAGNRDLLTTSYQRQYDKVTLESVLLASMGIVVFGSLVAWFFARLTRDIRLLEAHARQIVHGVRGEPMAVQRSDEVGSLMHAVNQMAADLDQREKQLEVEAERRSHHDKMLAVGALAAGMAHEVNNPLTIISGVAHELVNLRSPVDTQVVASSAQQILGQLQRASHAARVLADAAAPHPAERDWVDLNALVRRVVQLMGYDRRYRRLAFDTDLDTTLPAIRTVGDAVQQTLMQMISLACDALSALDTPEQRVRIRTRHDDERLEVQIAIASALDFELEHVRRGVLLARAIVEPLRGQLAFDQAPAGGSQISLSFPARSGDEPS